MTDFHVHSTMSDGSLSIPEVVDYYGQRGFGAIAITDHVCDEKTLIGRLAHAFGKTITSATFPIYREILKSEARRAMKQYNMILIPGQEVSVNGLFGGSSHHVLALGVTEFIQPEASVEQQCRQIHAAGGIAIAAHPVHTRRLEKQSYALWNNKHELSRYFDAWEVASGKHWFHEVEASGLPLLATSDFHKPGDMTAWKTSFYCEKTTESIFECIKNQELEFSFYHSEETIGDSHDWAFPAADSFSWNPLFGDSVLP